MLVEWGLQVPDLVVLEHLPYIEDPQAASNQVRTQLFCIVLAVTTWILE